MNAATTAEDPAEIEREIRRTQDNMSNTVDRIGDQLSIKNIFNALLDKADENNVDARMVLDGARRNPVALGLIAAGAIWLISPRDSKIPSMGSKSTDKPAKKPSNGKLGHRDYVSHMSTVEQHADEDPMAYQRRRDLARSNFFMVEREHDEEESAFRKRLDSMAGTFREKRHDWAGNASQLGGAAKERAQATASKAQNLYSDNPLVGGLIAMAVGAAFGTILPTTRREQETLRPLGEKARNVIGQQAEQMTGKAREKKDELLDKADAALKQSDSSSTPNANSDDGLQQQNTPFMVGH